MDLDFFDYMIEHIDWAAEELVGYREPELQLREIARGTAGSWDNPHGGGKLEGLAEAFRKYKRSTMKHRSILD
jgi:hypothetical protein